MEKTIAIWGTGHEAAKLMKWLSRTNSLSEGILGVKACEVAYFLDSNIEKTRRPFCDKPVKPAEAAWLGRKYTIVVAVVKNADIISELEKHGYSRLENYLTLEDFYFGFWQERHLPWTLIERLGVRDNDFLGGMQERIVPQDMADRFVRLKQALTFICEQRGHADWLLLLKDMLVSSILLADCDWPDKQAMGERMLDMVGIPKFVTCLENVYKQDLAGAAEWMPPPANNMASPNHPSTIAMYYMRFYNGGIERVISKLLQLFHKHGYKLVLFTDEIREDLEYSMPEEVIRVRLGYEGGRYRRCERLLQALKAHNVDIFCNHARGITFYDLFCVQLAGIPTVLELHNNFSFLENMPGENILSMGRRVNALVTLSRVDEMFWRLLGCPSVYVPNPVEPPEELETEPDRCTILWIQRIDQKQKQVMDLPEILEYVVHVMPEARLQIVGAGDDPAIEVRLRQKFEERGLTAQVDFLGFHTEVAQYYRQATVMLMTSCFEGFPMTIAESKRYGTPLVMYELPYLELLRDGRGYIAVPQHDKRAIAEALVRVLRDRKFRKQLSKDAKASLALFSKGNLMEAWETVFKMASSGKTNADLTEEEKTFGSIERLLLNLAARKQALCSVQ